MNIFIAICCDRHIDEVVKVFTTPEAAITYAKWFAEENAAYPANIQELQIADWLYYAAYSCEGDYVGVVGDILDPEEND